MTESPITSSTALVRLQQAIAHRFHSRDPELISVKRSIRAAIILPSVFAITHYEFSNPQVSLMSVFGSFGLLLLVDFPGRPRTRLISYLTYFVVANGLIALGTVASTHKVAAVVAMGVVAFAILFVGIASPRAAAASTGALLTFVLPVAVAAPNSDVGPRLLGYLIASAFCIPACMLIWPTPWYDNVRQRLSATVKAVANLVTAHAEGRLNPDAKATVESELKRLRDEVSRAPYPAAGVAAAAVNMARLVGRVEWVASTASLGGSESATIELLPVRAVLAATAETLFLCASLVSDGSAHPVDDPRIVDAVRESSRRLDALLNIELDVEISTFMAGEGEAATPGLGDDGIRPSEVSSGIAISLDPSFHARTLGIATTLMADAALEASGIQPMHLRETHVTGITTGLVWRQLASHLSFQSVWFRNAVRGAIGLALAVMVVELTNVEHGFWIVLGALSVLRSNALDTGTTAVRAIGGTAVGFAIGAAIMIGVTGHLDVLWAFLPIVIFAAGVAPVLISFAASQAAFTVVLIILFNIIAPVGWRIGITRIEDVAIGCGISIGVGVLFWPRGATAALGRALSDSLSKNSSYLAGTVERLTAGAQRVDTSVAAREGNSASLRLADAFRQYLAERGAKHAPLDALSTLFNGTNRIRLAAITLASLPEPSTEQDKPELESVAIAGAVLRDSYTSSQRWYEEFAEMLTNSRDSLDPPPTHDETLHDVLRNAFEDARTRHRPDQLRTTLQMLWADELLESQREVQSELASSADLFVRGRRTAS